MPAIETQQQTPQERLLDIEQRTTAIIDAADKAGRNLTEQEDQELEQLLAEGETLKRQISLRQRANEIKTSNATSRGRATQTEPIDGSDEHRSQTPKISGGILRNDDKRRHGWRSLGEMAAAVRRAAIGRTTDDRLLFEERAALSTYGSEGIGADGGFAVPPDFRNDILNKVMGEDSLVAFCRRLTTASNAIEFPKNEVPPWDTSSGLQAYWEGEAAATTQSKPSMQKERITLNKLSILTPVTDELMDDAVGLGSYLGFEATNKFTSKINLSIVQGTGVGQPTGILNAASTISVAKEGSQAADTILFPNIVKMWSRLYGPLRSNAVWLINQDIEPQLFQMAFLASAASPVPAYMPANGLSGSPYSTLMGRPLIPVQACETLGDQGDIILADLNQFVIAEKATGMEAATSIHLWFDQHTTAFRFTMRLGGQPWYTSAISPRDGSNTYGAFVTLAERA